MLLAPCLLLVMIYLISYNLIAEQPWQQRVKSDKQINSIAFVLNHCICQGLQRETETFVKHFK